MARRLRECVRADDTVARLGGDEFSIVLSEFRSPEDAGRVAEKLSAAVQRPMMISGVPVAVSASIGISIFPDDAADAGTLMRHADRAMYEAKRAGKNDFRFYADSKPFPVGQPTRSETT